MFDDIINELAEGNKYKNNLIYPTKSENMKEGYITDENKSVIWNREQVDINKENYKSALNAYRKRSNEVHSLIRQDVINIIIRELHCTEQAADLLFNKAYESEHSEGWEAILYEIENLVDTIIDFNKLN